MRSLDLKEEEDDAATSCPSLKEAAAIVKERPKKKSLELPIFQSIVVKNDHSSA
jgi:hypothetical protein